MIKIYQESNFVDCRVNAYPSYTEYKGIQRYPPNLIFADLDRSLFISNRSLERALSEALKTIQFKINGFPTVLWTGNGYHIYQPIDASVLEQYTQFEEFENPSAKFIRFAEHCLTGGKSDPFHNPSFKSCMMRIPGSLNSKYPTGRNKVTIFQKWNGYRPSMNLLLLDFHDYLIEQKIREIKLKKRIEKRFGKRNGQPYSISWIEALLETPIDDYRKNTIGLILSPYLINIKKLTYEHASIMIQVWLKKCNELRPLDSNFDYRVKYSLKTSIKKLQLPMKFITLEKKNKKLHKLLAEKILGVRH